jgi:hypothetical protein
MVCCMGTLKDVQAAATVTMAREDGVACVGDDGVPRAAEGGACSAIGGSGRRGHGRLRISDGERYHERYRRICRRVNKNCSHAHVSIPSVTTYIGVTHDDSRSQSRSNCPT